MDDQEIDEIGAAFVELKIAQFAEGRLVLSIPMTADEFEAMSDSALAAAKADRGAS